MDALKRLERGLILKGLLNYGSGFVIANIYKVVSLPSIYPDDITNMRSCIMFITCQTHNKFACPLVGKMDIGIVMKYG